VWDAQTGQELLTLKGHSAWVTGMAFSPDGKRLASAASDRTVKVWDAQTGQELLSVEGHNEWENGVAFSPNGYWLASGAADGTVKIWDATPLPEKLLNQAQGDARNSPATQTPQQAFQKLQQDYRNETVKITVRSSYAQKFLELVEKNPKDPAALEAFLASPFDGPFTPFGADPLKTKVLDLLVHNQLQSEKLGELVTTWLSKGSRAGPAGGDPAREQLLRTILAKSPHRAVQSEACWALAQYLKHRSSQPGLTDADKVAREADELFERLIHHYAEVLVASLPPGSIDPAREQLLRSILAKSPQHAVQGQACWALAQYIENLAERWPADSGLAKEADELFERAINQYQYADVFAAGKYAEELVARPLTDRIPDPAREKLLRTILAKHPNHAVQGQAGFYLALYLKNLSERGQPADRQKVAKEAEELFERVINQYADVRRPPPASNVRVASNVTLAFMAKAYLQPLRFPVVIGKPVPEIEAEDQDGVKFKLSDYRGKVVLLHFRLPGRPGSQATYAQERSLVKRLEGKPFVLLGSTSAQSKEVLKRAMEEAQITWRSFPWSSPGGPNILVAWSVSVGRLHTLFVIDHKGILRQRYEESPGAKVLDAVIDKLVQEAEAAQKGGSK
jgi:peroxiredoxin